MSTESLWQNVPEKLGKLSSVLRVLVHTQLQVLAKVFVELAVVILVLSNLSEHLQALLDDVLADDLNATEPERLQDLPIHACSKPGR